MEELEDPTESLQEKIHEEAEEKRKEKWTLYVVLSTALMAVLAAFSGWLGGHHANEALIAQMKSSDQWAYYQAKGIKSEIATSEGKILSSVTHQPVPDDDQKKTERYTKEQEAIKQTAEEFQKESEEHLNKHMILSRSVTIFQVSITLAAISVLMKRKSVWLISIAMCLVGIVFLVMGLL
ncbi:MAG: DUF4337 domain-containing protein [Chitinophagales bacterium]